MRLLVSCRFAPYSETPLLAVRHGLEAVERDGNWIESFAPDCWLAGGQNAEVQLGHDSDAIGHVVTAAAVDRWHFADCVVETDDPETLAAVRIGAPVSLGARSIRRDDDVDLRIRRHTLAQLEHIAIARRGEHPGYQGAQIVGVTKSKLAAAAARTAPPSSSSGGWLDGLPDYWKDFVAGVKPGAITELIEDRQVAYRWDGSRWVGAGGLARAA